MLSWQRSFQFENCIHLLLYRAFFWGMSLFPRSTGLGMGSHQSWKSKQKCMEQVHFTSLIGYNLNFPANFGLAAAWFLAEAAMWSALTAASPKNGRNTQMIACETSKMDPLQTFLFWTLNFDNSPFLSQLTKEKVTYLKRKLSIVANECSFEIGRISIMRACEIKRVTTNLYGSPCMWEWKF